MLRASLTHVRTKGVAFALAAAIGTAVAMGSMAVASQRAHACADERARTRVDGVVLDREGHGVAGALVVARRAGVSTLGDPLAAGVLTDRDGRFRMSGLPPGDYAFVSLCAGAIAATPEMPVFDRLVVTISLAEATRT
jgi:hypothetical protein